MTALKQLSAAYVVTAGAFVAVLAMSAHPNWSKKSESAAIYLRIHGTATAMALDEHVLHPGWTIAEKESKELDRQFAAALRMLPHSVGAAPTPVRDATPTDSVTIPLDLTEKPLPARGPTAVASTAARPRSPETAEATLPAVSLRGNEREKSPDVAAAKPVHPFELAPQIAAPEPLPSAEPDVAAPQVPPPSPAEVASVEQRLTDSLTGEMLANFELFLYVSKADEGPWAQHMYVFRKEAGGDLTMLYGWPVSTGREQVEFTPSGRQMATITPDGYYELDPKRTYVHHRSAQWGKSMPYAMFFNWIKDGNQTGLAIHAATGDDVALLGTRASAGCIHLAPGNARVLFSLIRSQYRGLAPRFAIDRRTGTMSNDGILLHDADGNVKMAEGYKVLVFIENYGGDNVVAALF